MLPVYEKDGRKWVVGTPGQEYAIRVCNTTGARVLAVMSVDGVNVVSGETASPSQSGYVLDAWQCADINGWRKNLASIAAFYFTELPDSYAARTGRPDNVGVIGVAFFRERPQPVAWKDMPGRIAPQSAAAEPSTRQEAAGGSANDTGRVEAERKSRSDFAAAHTCAGAHGENRHRIRTQRALVCADDALRARERDAERDDRISLRSPREPDRDGHPAAAGGRALVESVPGVDAALRSGSAAALARCASIVA